MRGDEDLELPVVRTVNNFMIQTLKQSWRLKHHPLTQKGDLFQLIPGIEVPVDLLMKNVIEKIEEFDRRIIGVDSKSGSFFVYCPNPFALSDLWAMCDVINKRLLENMFSGPDNSILLGFDLKAVNTRTVISGPEFLKYKRLLVKNIRPKCVAF